MVTVHKNVPSDEDLIRIAAEDQSDRRIHERGVMNWDILSDRDAPRQSALRRWLNAHRSMKKPLNEMLTDAIWILAMHADSSEEIYAAFRFLLVRTNDKHVLASLCDRALVMRGQPQVFGTQLTRQNGDLQTWPCSKPDQVSRFREALGLEPLNLYVEHLRHRYSINPSASPSASRREIGSESRRSSQSQAP